MKAGKKRSWFGLQAAQELHSCPIEEPLLQSGEGHSQKKSQSVPDSGDVGLLVTAFGAGLEEGHSPGACSQGRPEMPRLLGTLCVVEGHQSQEMRCLPAAGLHMRPA